MHHPALPSEYLSKGTVSIKKIQLFGTLHVWKYCSYVTVEEPEKIITIPHSVSTAQHAVGMTPPRSLVCGTGVISKAKWGCGSPQRYGEVSISVARTMGGQARQLVVSLTSQNVPPQSWSLHWGFTSLPGLQSSQEAFVNVCQIIVVEEEYMQQSLTQPLWWHHQIHIYIS